MNACVHVYLLLYAFVHCVHMERVLLYFPAVSRQHTTTHTVNSETLPTVRFLNFPNNVTRLTGQPIIPPLALPDVIRGEGTSGLAILLPIRKKGGDGVSTSVRAVAIQRSGSQRTSRGGEINFAVLFFLFTNWYES